MPAGTVTFKVSNDATDMEHEMLIIKTDKSPDELPLDDKGNLNEDALNIVGTAEDIPAGQSKTVTVDLQAGHYLLACNKPGHFQQGMYTDFNVTKTGTPVNVSLTTYKISPDTDSVPAGTVTFNVSNDATDMEHEMLIIKTDKSPDELPLDDKGNLNEDALNIVGAAEDIPAGESKTVTVDLQAGHYLLACNKPGHFQQGMYTDFTVSESTASPEATNQEATAEATSQATPEATSQEATIEVTSQEVTAEATSQAASPTATVGVTSATPEATTTEGAS